MAVLTYNNARSGCYLGESSSLNIINEEIIIASGEGVLDPGTVLGLDTEGAQNVVTAAGANNAGNGAIGTPTADADADNGVYTVRFIEGVVDAGEFVVEKPDGTQDGTGSVGVAYDGSVNFTIADGSNDFEAGDYFTINVTYAAVGKYVALDLERTDGGEVTKAILFHAVDATSADVTTVGTVRGPATVVANQLVLPDGVDADETAAIHQALRDLGLAVLPQHAA